MKWTAWLLECARWRSSSLDWLAIVIVAAGLAAVPAHAQRVTGTVRDSASDQPIRGVVITLTDSAGRFLARSVSDTTGRFAVPRMTGAARLNAMRIGYRPRTLTLSREASDSVVNVHMQVFISLVDAVASTTTRVCPGDQANAGALELWEQARAGLLATIVSGEVA